MKNKISVLLAGTAIGILAAVGSAGPASAAHPQPTTSEDCKNGEFAEYKTSLSPTATQRFSNQGECVRFVQTGKG